MGPERIASILAQTGLFGVLDPDSLGVISNEMTTRAHPRGSYIFLQGDPGDRIYVVAEGLLKVIVTSVHGEEMVLETLACPATFGELALLDGQPRSATVEVVSDAVLVSIHGTEFADWARRQPVLYESLLRSVSNIVRRLTDQTSDFVFLDLLGRTAKLLLRLGVRRDVDGQPIIMVDLPLTQSDLAAMVGTSRQSVNQALRTLEKLRCIDIAGRAIAVTDADALRRRAGMGTAPPMASTPAASP